MPFFPFRFSLLIAGSLSLATGCAEAEEATHSAVLYVAAGTNETSVFAGFLDSGYGASKCSTGLVDRCYVTTCLDGGGVQTYVDGGEVDFKGDELEATLDTGAVEDAAGKEGPGWLPKMGYLRSPRMRRSRSACTAKAAFPRSKARSECRPASC